MTNEKPTLDGTAGGSNGLLTGSEADKQALAEALKKKDPLVGSYVGSNGLTSNDLDKAMKDATPPKPKS